MADRGHPWYAMVLHGLTTNSENTVKSMVFHALAWYTVVNHGRAFRKHYTEVTIKSNMYIYKSNTISIVVHVCGHVSTTAKHGLPR